MADVPSVPPSVPPSLPSPPCQPPSVAAPPQQQPDLSEVVRRQSAEIEAQSSVIVRLREEVKRLKDQRARCQCFKPSAVASMQLTGQAADLLSFLPASPSTPRGAGMTATSMSRAVPSGTSTTSTTDKQVEALQRSLVEQGKELARMDAKLEAYKRHVQMMTSTRDDLPTAVTRAAGAAGAGDDCCRPKTTQIKRLQRLLEERTSLVDALKGSIEASTKQISALRASNRELETLKTSFLARADSAASELARMHREVHRLREELARHGQRGLNPASGATGDVFTSPGSDGMQTPLSKLAPGRGGGGQPTPPKPAAGSDSGGLMSYFGW